MGHDIPWNVDQTHSAAHDRNLLVNMFGFMFYNNIWNGTDVTQACKHSCWVTCTYILSYILSNCMGKMLIELHLILDML